MFDFDIKFLQFVLPAGGYWLGHLWWTKSFNSPPDYYGPVSLEFEELLRQRTVELAYPTDFAMHLSTEEDREHSGGFLASFLSAIGVKGLDFRKVVTLKLEVTIEAKDLVRRFVPPASLSWLEGKQVPSVLDTGKYVVSYAQFEGSEGNFTIKYDESKAQELGVEFAKIEGASVNHQASRKGQVTYGFKADARMLFGVSVQHIFERHGAFGTFGDKDAGFHFVKV